MNASDLNAAFAAFAGYHRNADYVSQVKGPVEAFLAFPAAEVACALCGDKKALRALSQECLSSAMLAVQAFSSYVVSLDAAPALREVSYLLYRENRRRRTNAAREANVGDRAANVAGLAEQFPVGSRCEVHAFGYWYAGEVVRHASKGGKVEVRYTSGTGVSRNKLVGSDLLRAASK